VERQQHADLMAVDVDDRMVPPEGVASSLDKLKEQVAAAGVVSERRDAVEFLLEWASAPSSPPFCALLGESGIGKTVTCKMFTQRLLAAREKQPQLPLPIYLDLRHLGEVARSNPDIVTIVRTVISRSWRMPLDLDIKPEEIHHLVTEQGAIVIFDGLDEVLVQLSPIAGQQFTRELWRILHGRRRQTRRSPQGSSESASGKLLISCRTHYFRTLREQQTHLTGEDREGLWSRDYRALMLLPFRDDQIEAYLRANLPQRDVGQVRSLIASVHNLTDLAERPYTLSLLAEQIPNLERWHAQGHRISGVTLYRHVIESWLERDQGKHQIRPSHKQLLMEHFAAALWRSGKQSWIVDDLEQWLIDFLVEHPRIAAHYDMKDREVLKEDLRTATFLVRPGNSRFQFAHTSLQEFFLASYLWRALRDNRPSDWDMAVPSLETLDFLGQLLDEDGTGCFATLRAIRDEYQRGRSELALAYGLRAQAGGWPAHPLSGSHLRGADLGGYQFEGLESRMLALNEVDFTGANLSGAVFRHVVLDRTSFAHADLDAAEFMGARMRGCLFRGSSLSGTIFRDADMERSDLEAARFQRTQFLRCRISHVHGMADDKHALFALCEPETAQTHKPAAADAQLEIFTGHFGNVYDIAYSPVGQHLASAGEDGTVRVWDLKRGEELRLLRGHTDAVSTCAFSPDGRQLASAGKDGSIRLWDATTGAFVRLLSGHEGGVFRCAFSSDGRELVSVGADGSSRIWDVASAIPLRVLSLGTHDALWSVCSKDGRYVASVAEDGTVRLWNTRNGDVRVVLRKRNEKDSDEVYPQALSADSQHLATSDPEGRLAIWDIAGIKPVETRLKQTSIVTASAFSSDGHLFLAAQDNGDIRLWNTATGQLLFDECQDLHAIPACAFAPNGGQFATGAENGTLRLYAPGFMGEVVRVCEGTDRVNACNLSPDGRCLASALDDGSVRVIDALAGKPRLVLLRPDRAVVSCVFSPDGRQLASSDDDGFVVLWCRETGEQLRTLDISDHGYVTDVNDCAFLPDNRHIVAIESDGTVSIWDTQQAVRVRVVSAENVVRFSCVISPDGERIAWVGEDEFLSTLNLTDASTYHFPMHGNGVAACAFSPDGRYVISACTDGSLHIWDSVNMELRRTWQAHDDLASLCAFSADGRIVASHGRDGMLALWDSTTGERLRSLQRAQQSLSHCSFSPDGRLLVFVEGRTIVHRWDLSSGRLLPLIRHLPEGELVLISEDGSIAGATANAWRWIGWAAPDPRTGELTRYPAEIFGPLPLLRTPTKHD
jgi:WD40 repeat protein